MNHWAILLRCISPLSIRPFGLLLCCSAAAIHTEGPGWHRAGFRRPGELRRPAAVPPRSSPRHGRAGVGPLKSSKAPGESVQPIGPFQLHNMDQKTRSQLQGQRASMAVGQLPDADSGMAVTKRRRDKRSARLLFAGLSTHVKMRFARYTSPSWYLIHELSSQEPSKPIDQLPQIARLWKLRCRAHIFYYTSLVDSLKN